MHKTVFFIDNDIIAANCTAAVKELPRGKYVVEIKPKPKTRRQECYLHALLGIIAEHQGVELETLKLTLKYEWLPLRLVRARGRDFLYPISTTELSKEQYGVFIDRVLMLGESLGLFMPPETYYGEKNDQNTKNKASRL